VTWGTTRPEIICRDGPNQCGLMGQVGIKGGSVISTEKESANDITRQ
jgi:hypothetical protein